LPDDVKNASRKAYRLFAENPNHPSLAFKKLPPYPNLYSARVTYQYRVVGRLDGDTLTWFFIGTHAEYDRLLD
jgi:hypothetical protein